MLDYTRRQTGRDCPPRRTAPLEKTDHERHAPGCPRRPCVACILQLRSPAPLFIASQCFKQGQAAASPSTEDPIRLHQTASPSSSTRVPALNTFKPSLTAPYGFGCWDRGFDPSCTTCPN
ncbi:hypothetical protein MHYP_G00090270 [Metynnis hypsauchen]